jgi:4-amino-4-deoxy-L-arabinose transferase-like glycosyltransferase
MRTDAREQRRSIRPGVYVVFFLLFAVLVFLPHLPLIQLPYFWDEAGQFIPAALDILRGGHWIPRSTVPNIHPPAIMAYLAAVWQLTGYHPAATRCAMLMLASVGVLAAFLLAIELSRAARGRPALLAAALLCASPVYFSQAMLAQLDAPAMLFTTAALLWFLQDRIRLSAMACVALVLVKETGIVVPLVLAAWLVSERRRRDALYFAAPAVVLGIWVLFLVRATGHWTGNTEFARFNLYDPLSHPLRLLVTFLRRLYYLVFANLHWLGAIAILLAWRRSAIFHSRPWRVAWTLLAAHVVLFTLLGGAVLERYLLPVMPVLYAAMAVGLTLWRPMFRLIGSLALIGGLVAANFIKPPYPFPYENNLAFTDFVKLHARTADFLENSYPAAGVHTVWPLSAVLAKPELGYVDRGLAVEPIADLTKKTLASLDWERVHVLVVYSRSWSPPLISRLGAITEIWQRHSGHTPNATREEARSIVPLPLEVQFDRGGQWVDVYVNPAPVQRPRDKVREGGPPNRIAAR